MKDFFKIVRLVLAAVSINGLRLTLEIVDWSYDTFDNNLGITNNLTIFLKESCWL